MLHKAAVRPMAACTATAITACLASVLQYASLLGARRLVNAAYARPGTCVTPGAATSYCCKPPQPKSGRTQRTHSAKTSLLNHCS